MPMMYGQGFKVHNAEADPDLKLSIIEMSSKLIQFLNFQITPSTQIEVTFYIKNLKERGNQINNYPCKAGMDYPPMDYFCIYNQGEDPDSTTSYKDWSQITLKSTLKTNQLKS